jgi:hypothetical protein
MGYSLGGFIFRNAADVEDEEILAVLDEGYRNVDRVDMHEAPAKSARDIAVAKVGDKALVLSKTLPNGCSFEQEELSRLDLRLEEFSARGEVLCFLMDSVSDTYAYSFFRNGKRVRAMSTSGGQLLSDWGEGDGSESKQAYTGDDVVEVIDRFMGIALGHVLYDNTIEVYVYYN